MRFSTDPTTPIPLGHVRGSFWAHAPGREPFDPPLLDTRCEVCVVGGGVSGAAVTYALALEGRDTIMLDEADLASGETQRSTAHLVTALDERYVTIERKHGAAAARTIAAAHRDAIEWIERVAAHEQIACDFARVPGYLAAPAERKNEAEALVANELAAARRAGVECDTTMEAILPVIDIPLPMLRFPDQAEIDPVLFVDGLAERARRRGSRVHCGARVVDLARDGRGWRVHMDNGVTITADRVVIATRELPSALRNGLRRITTIVSYVTAFELSALPARFLLWDGYWDSHSPYHFVRFARALRGEGITVLVGGEDDRGAEPTDESGAYERLESWTRTHIPAAGQAVARWWGRISEPEGEFALIGQVPDAPSLFVIAGDSGNGMTHAATAARILPDLMFGRVRGESALQRLHDPASGRHRISESAA